MTPPLIITARHGDDGWTLDEDDRVRSLTAAVATRIPASPPAIWFSRDDVPEGSPLTFTDAGRVYGLLAPNNVAHVGLPGRVYAPTSSSRYSYFHTGEVRCEDGKRVSTGRLTMLTGHETDDTADARTAAAHYDNTGTAVADVVAWDSPVGVMCAGAARPGLTAEQIRMAMASPASGDWRKVNGKWEMVAALLVNTAGFPVPREAVTASADANALIASGFPPPIVVITTNAIEQQLDNTEEAPVADTDPTPDPVTAAADTPEAAPSVEGDMVSLTASGDLVGMVTGADDADMVTVQIEVPRSQVAAASDQQIALVSSAVKQRLRDREIEARFETLTASVQAATERAERAEAQARGASAQPDLDAIPALQQ